MRTLLVTTALATTLLAGCSEAEDIVRGAAEDAGCAAAQQAMDEAERRARDAVADLKADPQAAERELTAVRDVLAAAEQGLGGETRQQVDRAGKAVGRLLTQARGAAEGTRVDDEAVADAERRLDDAVGEITTVC
ncbi:hypothetical protein [Nocardioides deserti]|uniref:Mucin-associated surface protein n=1 Tax=Nocardioides deserti TaxID=1588644 RepID=A0ABR6U9C6_9ACTN|nr:hypothetical protein [Nocardioides deserti]MBC2961047.1 hypothetical protein [Nocardioides deserti]GGO76207.1 hypothetical protein GCM10012276_28410 [Nocardioides deserti]